MELSNQLPGSHPLTAPVHPPERVTGPPELHHSEGRYPPGPGEAKALDAIGDASRAARAARRIKTPDPGQLAQRGSSSPGEFPLRRTDKQRGNYVEVVAPRPANTPPGQANRAARAQARDPQSQGRARQRQKNHLRRWRALQIQRSLLTDPCLNTCLANVFH